MPSPELALVGAVAKLLNEGLGTEVTMVAVAETLRRDLPAAAVTVWLREHGTPAFRAVHAPPAPDGPGPVRSLDTVPLESGWRRCVLEHEGMRLGLLDVRLGAGSRDPETLPIVADFLAPYLAASELSVDLAGEVAAQSREIEEHRRFTSLIVDSLPVGLYVVDRDYRIQSWNRKRETGTQGLRRDDVVQRYAQQSGRDVSQLDFYEALAAYKLAIILEGIHARFLMGKTVGDGFDHIGSLVEVMVQGALDQCSRSSIAALRG